MSATWLYRIAAVLLVLFAAGHTFGFLKFEPPSPAGVAARDAMRNARFPIGGTEFTYSDFYTGFGLFVTVYLLFSAFLAWQLGELYRTGPHAIAAISWAFFIAHVGILVLSWIYFFTPPTVFSGLVAACLGWAAWIVTTS